MAELRPGTTMWRIAELERLVAALQAEVAELRSAIAAVSGVAVCAGGTVSDGVSDAASSFRGRPPPFPQEAPMKYYLAARYSRRLELCGYRADLAGLGIEVTSRWLSGSHQLDDKAVPITDEG